MSNSYHQLDDTPLQNLLAQRRINLARLESQAAVYGSGERPLSLSNQIDGEQREIDALLAELRRRGVSPVRDAPAAPATDGAGLPDMPAAGPPAPLARPGGSPFVVGRPLRATEPIFGREPTFRFIAGELAKFSSVNVIAERRMGKTSLLNHLLGHQDVYLPSAPGQPPLVPARIDLQNDLSAAAHFYGVALRGLLHGLPAVLGREPPDLAALRVRLDGHAQASYEELERTLRRLRAAGDECVRPVLLIDEFERLLDDGAQGGFPYPDFFNGLRALITADLLAIVIFSRDSLATYFTDPKRTHSLTSTFPTYFVPFSMPLLDEPAADALLLQASDHPLTVNQVTLAKQWAAGHPCHLQAAGQACYEATREDRPTSWAQQRYLELQGQACLVNPVHEAAQESLPGIGRRIWRLFVRLLQLLVLHVPLHVGRLAQGLGGRLDDMAAWLIGAAVVTVVVMVLLGLARGADVLEFIKKGLGL